MNISMETLNRVFQILICKMKESEQSQSINTLEVVIPYDYYWSTPMGARANVLKPVENDIGSIEHDIERLIQCVSDEDPNSHHFRYLGNVLIAIADALEEQNLLI